MPWVLQLESKLSREEMKYKAWQRCGAGLAAHMSRVTAEAGEGDRQMVTQRGALLGECDVRRWECEWVWAVVTLHAAGCGPVQQERRLESSKPHSIQGASTGQACEHLPLSPGVPRVSPAVARPWPRHSPSLDFALDRRRLHKQGAEGRRQVG